MKKHIKPYSAFVLEQDMGLGVPAPGMPAAGAVKKEKPLLFIFIDDLETEGTHMRRYPDGSKAIDFPSYSVTPTEIEDWAKKNILVNDNNKLTDSVLDLRRKNLVNIVKGDKVNISDEDIPFIEKLRQALSTDIFGKREPDVNVIFTKGGLPTTEEISVTFIKYKK
jgi:hypothetical protein